MKKIVSALFILSAFTFQAGAQTTTTSKKANIGFSFIANDYATPEKLRTTSYAAVKRNDQWAKLKDMGHGFAVHYVQNQLPNIDIMATFGGSFVEFTLPGKNTSSNNFLAELDVAANFKMFKEAVFNPFLTAGVGASKYTNVYGAFVPVGGGVAINLFNEAKLVSQFQYRVPVTTDASKHHFMVSFGIMGNL